MVGFSYGAAEVKGYFTHFLCTGLAKDFRSYIDYVGRGASGVTKFYSNWQVIKSRDCACIYQNRGGMGLDRLGYIGIHFGVQDVSRGGWKFIFSKIGFAY